MDKFNMADMSVWQGRQDPEDGELALRWHNKVQPWQADSEPGVVLLGFACDEGVRRNKGRVGTAAAPLAGFHFPCAISPSCSGMPCCARASL
mgnify:CR=1 FL=1